MKVDDRFKHPAKASISFPYHLMQLETLFQKQLHLHAGVSVQQMYFVQPTPVDKLCFV